VVLPVFSGADRSVTAPSATTPSQIHGTDVRSFFMTRLECPIGRSAWLVCMARNQIVCGCVKLAGAMQSIPFTVTFRAHGFKVSSGSVVGWRACVCVKLASAMQSISADSPFTEEEAWGGVRVCKTGKRNAIHFGSLPVHRTGGL